MHRTGARARVRTVAAGGRRMGGERLQHAARAEHTTGKASLARATVADERKGGRRPFLRGVRATSHGLTLVVAVRGRVPGSAAVPRLAQATNVVERRLAPLVFVSVLVVTAGNYIARLITHRCVLIPAGQKQLHAVHAFRVARVDAMLIGRGTTEGGTHSLHARNGVGRV